MQDKQASKQNKQASSSSSNIGFFRKSSSSKLSASDKSDKGRKKLLYSAEKREEHIKAISKQYQSNPSNIIVHYDKKSNHQVCAYKDNGDKDFINIYSIDRADSIGEGGSSHLCSAYNLKTNEKKVAKISKDRADLRDFKNEDKILQILNIPHETYNYIKDQERYIIFMDYYPGMNFVDFLYEKNSSFDCESEHYFYKKKEILTLNKLKIIKSVLEAIAGIHAKGVWHRDIKAENLLINELVNAFHLRLIDFGASIESSEKKRSIVTTPGYIAPEVLKNQYYSESSDLFSLGVLVGEILTELPYQAYVRRKRNQKIMEADGFLLNNELSVLDILRGMPDVFIFTHHDNKKVKRPKNDQEMDDFIFGKLQMLAHSLVRENPETRLAGSSLTIEINKLGELLEYVTLWREFNEKKGSTEKLNEIERKLLKLELKLSIISPATVVMEDHDRPKEKYFDGKTINEQYKSSSWVNTVMFFTPDMEDITMLPSPIIESTVDVKCEA